jgi:hypothetical protein
VNNIKFGVLASGLIGLIACFLPLASGEGMSISFWDMHNVDMAQTMMVMAGYGLGLAMGAMAAAKPPMLRWQAIVALLGFAFVVFKFRGGFLDLITHGAIGAKLMGLAAIAGLVFSGLCLAKPEATK